MKFHKFLQKQIDKHLPLEWLDDPKIQPFIEAVNESFLNHERDNYILQNAFEESENEFNEVNAYLKDLIRQKSTSVDNLLESLQDLNPELDINKDFDLVSITAILDKEIKKSKRLEKLNRNILESSLNAILYFDKIGKIKYWNREAEKIFGYTESEAIEMDFYKILSEECQRRFSSGIFLYLEEGNKGIFNKILEAHGITKNNKPIELELHIIPIEENNEVYFCAFIQDITDRKVAELNLKIQEEKYRSIINNSKLGLVEVDNNDRVIFANQSFSAISGYSLDELMGKNLTELLKASAHYIKGKEVLRKQGISDQYTLKVCNHKGEVRWWNVSGSPRYDKEGNIIGSIGIHLDVTDQKKMEQNIIKAKEEAEQNSNTKEAILTTMSHEIRTPLNGIIGMINELVQKNKNKNLDKPINYALLASNHLLSIVNNILDYSKIEAGQMTVHYEPNNLNDSVKKVVEILKPKIREKNLKIEVNSEVYSIHKFDALKIEQILFNVIGNAIKFTDNGKVSVNLKEKILANNKSEIEISITDSGIGMDQVTISNLFKKYKQGNTQSNLKHKGTGLGMAITKEIAHLLGGEIAVKSKVNQGTTFTFTFVFMNCGTEKEIKENKSNKLDFSDKKVLIVDDNEMNRLVAENAMINTGAKLFFAKDGNEALDLSLNQNFDLIMLDLFLPFKNGTEVAYELRNVYNNKTPIIAMSANINQKYIDDCKKAGMDDYIVKPFSEAELFEKIVNLTSEKKIFNLDALETMSRGNDEFVLKMIQIFIKNTEEMIPNLSNAITNDEVSKINGILHKAKPSVNTLQIKEASRIISDLEVEMENINSLSTEQKEMLQNFMEVMKEAQLQLHHYSKKWKNLQNL